MPRQLAAVLCATFIVWLLVRDLKANPTVSRAVWLPWFWFGIKGSKSLTQWLYGFTVLESNPVTSIDRYLIFALAILGLLVLVRRSFSWSNFISKNWALSFYLTFTLVSMAWSEIPAKVFTQWNHMLLQFLMVLVIFTEQEPTKAFVAVFRRCAYVLIPMSVLYLKYFPELGRMFDQYGLSLNVGVTADKNRLGATCWVLGVFFLSTLFAGPRGKRVVSGGDRYIALLFLGMSMWLIWRSETSTAVVSFIISAGIILGMQFRVIWKRFTLVIVIGSIVAGMLLTFTDIKDRIILALGEDLTLTGRTELWADLQSLVVNPVVGAGFESFWTGSRLQVLWAKYWWHPNQAHNGYFEMYLNLGIVGLLAMCAMVFSCYKKARRQMLIGAPNGVRSSSLQDGITQFRLSFLFGFLASNWTDSPFRSVEFLFLVFVAVSLEYVSLPRKVFSEPSKAFVKSRRALRA